MQIHKIIKFSFINFYILISSYDSFTINVISYIFFFSNIHNQKIIKLLISHSITNILPKDLTI